MTGFWISLFQLIINFCFFTIIFFYLGFLSRTSTIHRTAGEGGGHLFNSALPFYPLHIHLDISLVITGDLHVAGLEPRAFGFPAQVTNHYATRPHDHFNWAERDYLLHITKTSWNIAMSSLRCRPILTSEIKTRMDVWETAYMRFHFRRNEYFQFSVWLISYSCLHEIHQNETHCRSYFIVYILTEMKS